jgi:biotin-dependent carboxylase-like uncharacterized protein
VTGAKESAALRVRATGPQALVEDLGRPGRAEIGVGRSGAADRAALRRANRALANDEGAAAVEVLLGGLEVEAVGGSVLACVTGAPAPVVLDGRPVGCEALVRIPQGSVLRVEAPARGLRSYLAVRGGLHVPEVLGSRSHDVMAGVGPAPLQKGDLLPVGPPPTAYPVVDQLLPADIAAPDEPVVLEVVRGPRDTWVRDADLLVRTVWRASERSNRVGMRLDGEGEVRLEHADRDRQLPSEGACRGAVQVPPSGEPVVFLADHPVTGGYPVVAVVVDADVDRAAQARPGQEVRFRWR